VPNPNHPGRFGGVSGHTDPGRFWNWSHYMRLVRHYAAHPVLPHFVQRMTLLDSPVPRRPGVPSALPHTAPVRAPAAPRRSVVERTAQVRGDALWWSGIDAAVHERRGIWKVDFRVDGRTLYTDHTWPFAFHRHDGWDTSTVANGRHMLTVLAYGARHYRLRKSIPIRVANPPMSLTVGSGLSSGAVSGQVGISVGSNEPIAGVALYVNGSAVSRDRSKPFRLEWDSHSVTEGEHTLTVYARGEHGRRSALRIPVVVANASTFPAALTSTALASDWSSAGPGALGGGGPER
jgi:hypothetical protein